MTIDNQQSCWHAISASIKQVIQKWFGVAETWKLWGTINLRINNWIRFTHEVCEDACPILNKKYTNTAQLIFSMIVSTRKLAFFWIRSGLTTTIDNNKLKYSYDKWLQTFTDELTRCWSFFSSLLLLFTCNFCLTRHSYLTKIIIKHHNNSNPFRYLCWKFDASLSAQNKNRLVFELRLQIGGTTNSLLSD